MGHAAITLANHAQAPKPGRANAGKVGTPAMCLHTPPAAEKNQ